MRWKMFIGGSGMTTRREGPMRGFNPRMRVLSLALLASVACVAPPFAAAGLAQTPAAQPSPDGAPFTVAFDSTVKLNADKTGEYLETRRVKVLGIASLQQVAQQSIEYVEGMQSFEILAAFTEKANGTSVPVETSRPSSPAMSRLAWAPCFCAISRSSRSSSRMLPSATHWC